MEGIIDRFEGKWAVIEINGQTQDIDRLLVDHSAKEGDVVVLVDNKWVRNVEKTKERSDRIDQLAKELWED